MFKTRIIQSLCLSVLCFGANIHVGAPVPVQPSTPAVSTQTIDQGSAAQQSPRTVAISEMKDIYTNLYTQIMSAAQGVNDGKLSSYISDNKEKYFQAVDNGDKETREQILRDINSLTQRAQKNTEDKLEALDILAENSTDEQRRAYIDRKLMEFQLSINLELIGTHGENLFDAVISMTTKLANNKEVDSKRLGDQYPIFITRAIQMLYDRFFSFFPAGPDRDKAEEIFALLNKKAELQGLSKEIDNLLSQ